MEISRSDYTNMDMSLRHFHGVDKSFIDKTLNIEMNKRPLPEELLNIVIDFNSK